ncbi:uncharacterized protein AB675_5606 [Cyphellophora attinorum]|uniref:Uncharacterized protein n=1 Tax=Cyphellophora attinorum TaxID=1664694 RepID=A0A0N1H738_9EURO|nr:uncharacterized protein AB675_5606 [Phialophora attinorum]KPI42113.1 hypothetical protein AB675_5606 [Phialophora attinorum]
MALPVLQPAFTMSALPVFSSPPASRTPSPEYIATRLHSIANYKLRLESSQNDPVLRKLLGHIFVYDAIRDHHQNHSVYTSPTQSRRRQQQLQRRQQSERSHLPLLSSVEEEIPASTESSDSSSSSSNAEDISNYLSTLPSADIPPSSVQAFVNFQQAIASQLATLSQLRLQNASRQLYHMTTGNDEGDEMAVEEYDSDEDIDDDSDYDSYDGDDADWRFEDDNTETGDSDTDPESVPSEPTSPTRRTLGRCQIVLLRERT